jgi:hypothetical protein
VESPTRARSRTSTTFILDERAMTTLDEMAMTTLDERTMTTLKMMVKDVAD